PRSTLFPYTTLFRSQGASGSQGILLQADSTIDVGAGSLQLIGLISGPGGLTKSGAGFLSVAGTGANTYFGGTTISGGILQLDNSDRKSTRLNSSHLG